MSDAQVQIKTSLRSVKMSSVLRRKKPQSQSSRHRTNCTPNNLRLDNVYVVRCVGGSHGGAEPPPPPPHNTYTLCNVQQCLAVHSRFSGEVWNYPASKAALNNVPVLLINHQLSWLTPRTTRHCVWFLVLFFLREQRNRSTRDCSCLFTCNTSLFTVISLRFFGARLRHLF